MKRIGLPIMGLVLTSASAPAQTDLVTVQPVILQSESGLNETAEAPPASVASLRQGESFVVELWAQQLVEDPGPPTPICGLSCVFLDLSYDEELMDCIGRDDDPSPAFDTLASGGCTPGLIDELGGCSFSMGLGITPRWVRVATVTMRAVAASEGYFVVSWPADTTISLCGFGNVPPEQVVFASAGVDLHCDTDVDCDDGNDCTLDLRDPDDPRAQAITGCLHEDMPYSTPCDDGDACTAGDTCSDSLCVGIFSGECRSDTECDKGNPCTTDWCDSDCECHHDPLECVTDLDCDDGDRCTEDTCEGGCCANEPLPACADDLVRVVPVVLQSESGANDMIGDPPTGAEIVRQGEPFVVEMWAQQLVEDPGPPSPMCGLSCVFADLDYNEAVMDCIGRDDDPSPAFDTLTSGSCASGLMDELGGCSFSTGLGITPQWVRVATMTMHAVEASQNQVVAAGAAGTTVSLCGFGNVPADKIVFESAEFDIGCASDDDCDDGNACTDDSCDPITGECVHDSIDCNDGDLCTDDSCDPAVGCVNDPVDCDDANLCTDDSCDPDTGECVQTPSDCSDDNACTNDSCHPITGQCVHDPIDCDDGDSCTDDSCDPTDGECDYEPVACPGGQVCDPSTGNCVCDDDQGCAPADPCQAGVCDPDSPDADARGCVITDAPDGTACDDGNGCTSGDSCQNGTCRGTPSSDPCCGDPDPCCGSSDPCCGSSDPCCGVDCDDNDLCTTDTCNAADGSCNNDAVVCPEGQTCQPDTGYCICTADNDCDDDLFCNGEEVCDSEGVCQPGTPPCSEDQVCDGINEVCRCNMEVPAGKVAICHFPPGNPDNPQTLLIAPQALNAHLRHGDYDLRCCPCDTDANCSPGQPCGSNGLCQPDSDGDGVPDDDDDCRSSPTGCVPLSNGCCEFYYVVTDRYGEHSSHEAPSDEYLEHTDAHIDARTSALAGWEFDSWTIDREPLDANDDGSLDVEMNSNKDVIAVFQPIPCVPSSTICGACGNGACPAMILALFGWLGLRFIHRGRSRRSDG